jgi:protein O-GlcNAc transferase
MKPEPVEFLLFDLQFLQCVCDWDDREEKFIKVEGIIRQQIKA